MLVSNTLVGKCVFFAYFYTLTRACMCSLCLLRSLFRKAGLRASTCFLPSDSVSSENVSQMI